MTHLLIYVNIYYDPFLLLCKLTKSLHVTFPKELFPAQGSYEPFFSNMYITFFALKKNPMQSFSYNILITVLFLLLMFCLTLHCNGWLALKDLAALTDPSYSSLVKWSEITHRTGLTDMHWLTTNYSSLVKWSDENTHIYPKQANSFSGFGMK